MTVTVTSAVYVDYLRGPSLTPTGDATQGTSPPKAPAVCARCANPGS